MHIFIVVITLLMDITVVHSDSGIVYSDEFEFVFIDNLVNWNKASEECAKEEGRRLVKIDSEDITTIIKEYRPQKNRWIGASDLNTEGTWVWQDRSSAARNGANYNNWSDGEPNDGGAKFKDEDCALVYGNGLAKWNDEACSNKYRIICQNDLTKTLAYGDQKFYYYRTLRKDYDEAKSDCQSNGMRLVEIYDENTDKQIRDCIKNPNSYMLLGGKKFGSSPEDINWDSGSIPTYTNGWAPGNPSNSEMSCITLTTNGWIEKPCSDSYPYICETLVRAKDLTLSTNRIIVDTQPADAVVCEAGGVPFPDVTWSNSRGEVTLGSLLTDIFQEKSNGRSVLNITNARLQDEGLYNCSAINYVGDQKFILSDIVQVIVPSSPAYVIPRTVNCSATVDIIWRPNVKAVNVTHRIFITNDNDSEVLFRIPTATDESQVDTVNLKAWTEYVITVTPCTEECKENYTIRNTTRTEGLPGEPTKLFLEYSGSYRCIFNWDHPENVANDFILGYNVIVNESLHDIPFGETQTVVQNETYLGSNFTNFVFRGRPNRIYFTGVQAETCFGFGNNAWTCQSCITEPGAPDNIQAPLIMQGSIRGDGTITITLQAPSQENGLMSCIFVMVRVNNGQEMHDAPINFDWKYLTQANTSSVEYIAVALVVSRLTLNRFDVVLGDRTLSQCDASLTADSEITRESTSSIIVGRNLVLDPHTNYSIFIVSATPTNTTDILLQSSESTEVYAVPEGPANDFAVVELVVGLLSFLIVLVVVTGGLIVTRRKRRKKQKSRDESEREYCEVQGRNAVYMNAIPTSGELDVGMHESSEEAIYQNQCITPMRTRSPTDIAMHEFEDFYKALQQNADAGFNEQFEELKSRATRFTSSTTFASNPTFKVKNRYRNILPFDHTRVEIRHSEDGYINACFINGFEHPKKFIATQGPLSSTVCDFWMMVFEQRCSVIVMLAKCVEAGKAKCEKYWPALGETSQFGDVTVTNVREVRFCGFVCRTLNIDVFIENERFQREVTQYHFLKWPDHGFPATTSYLMRMHQAVMKTWTSQVTESPIIVHCSAGAGRTGTFIGYDILLDERKSLGSVDVFTAVIEMRRQRVDMVQNCDQFIMVHKLILESHIFGDTDIPAEQVPERFAGTNCNARMAKEFENLPRVSPMSVSSKNMPTKTSAYERARISVFDDSGEDLTSSLDASYIEMYDESSTIIVCDHPTRSNCFAFWKLIYDSDVSVIVMISDDERESYQYWFDEGDLRQYAIFVEQEESNKHFLIRHLKIQGGDTKSLIQIHVEISPTEHHRKTAMRLNDTINRLNIELRESNGVGLVHCWNGTGMSGVFCGVMNLIERLKVENRVDMFRTIKDLRDCREEMVETTEQYVLCHDAILEYFHNFETYSNFK